MKGLFFGIALLVVLGVASIVIGATQPVIHPPTVPGQMEPYIGVAPLSFSYLNSYTLTERHDSFEGQPINVLTFIDSSIVIPDESEGPPAISIIVVPNPSNEPLPQWVKEKSISNFFLSPDHVLSSTTVAGEPAVSYTHTGLYESSEVAVAHGGYIYLFGVGSNNPTDAIFADFQKVLNTVQFR